MLIAVITCQKRRHHADAIRATWAKGRSDVRFFIGGGIKERDDEVILDVDDSYRGLPEKVRASMDWAITNCWIGGVLKVDDDTYIVPQRFAKLHPEYYDYIGNFREHTGNYPYDYASGFAYYLSDRARDIIAVEPLTEDRNEDRWVGNSLAKPEHRIRMYDEKRFHCASPFDISGPKYLWGSPIGKTHICFSEYPPERFPEMHYWYQRVFPQEIVNGVSS